MKHFRTPQERAAAYAAFKELERQLKDDGELAPGCNHNVAGLTVEITIPQGVTVSRDAGENNDGIVWKKATQNLYGYSVLAECLRIAKLFKQHKRLERLLLKIVRRAISRECSTETAFTELQPDAAQRIKELKASLNIPKREENTPRLINRPAQALHATITISQRRQAA